MRWDLDNAESMMALSALHRGGLWESYWAAERTAAWVCEVFFWRAVTLVFIVTYGP